MNCLAVYHIAFEDLGTFATPLRERGYAIAYRHAGTAPPSMAEWLQADLVVVLGGPLGVGDIAAYPWLHGELAGLRERLARSLPTLGICLGAQLMAVALGGHVTPRPQGKEIGWGELALAAPGTVLDPLRSTPVLHWHGDNIVLPPGARPLAATTGTPCQAFAVGTHALALQCHVEFDGAAQEAWLAGHAVELAHAGTDLAALRAGTARHAAALAVAGPAVLGRWLDGLAVQA